ncbi:hypothetical protein EXIGLDRAFT_832730 [Exidia glandulosa HHB12029]|uniref:LysM domain-containing protein n=1 Tax=Exidia glandulosa HHB12029 TaxID=1314781 RepID=A0A165LA97_EXIGL|nr:hypothetical protein EXIGLDRAFT_832730 [Exidia glandulosa HHB12029]
MSSGLLDDDNPWNDTNAQPATLYDGRNDDDQTGASRESPVWVDGGASDAHTSTDASAATFDGASWARPGDAAGTSSALAPPSNTPPGRLEDVPPTSSSLALPPSTSSTAASKSDTTGTSTSRTELPMRNAPNGLAVDTTSLDTASAWNAPHAQLTTMPSSSTTPLEPGHSSSRPIPIMVLPNGPFSPPIRTPASPTAPTAMQLRRRRGGANGHVRAHTIDFASDAHPLSQPPSPASSRAPSPEPVQLTHKVQRGDSLAGVALRYGVTVAALRRANGLWANDSIHLRAMLVVPDKDDALPTGTGTGKKKTNHARGAMTISASNARSVAANHTRGATTISSSSSSNHTRGATTISPMSAGAVAYSPPTLSSAAELASSSSFALTLPRLRLSLDTPSTSASEYEYETELLPIPRRRKSRPALALNMGMTTKTKQPSPIRGMVVPKVD